MRKSKLLAALMLAGLCGLSDGQAKSHKNGIKSLEKQRAQFEAERRESTERLRELNYTVGRKADDEDESDAWSSNPAPDDEPELVSESKVMKRSTPKLDSDSQKERETEAARAKAAEKEMARIDKAIRKEKAKERRERDLLYRRLDSSASSPWF